MLYRLISPIFEQFKYITFRSAFAAMFAFVLCLIVAPMIIRVLKAKKIAERTEKKDSELLVKLHEGKSSTPTMGGIIILLGLIGATLLFGRLNNIFVVYAILLTTGLGLIGFIDDYVKLTAAKQHGITKSTKFFSQMLLGLAVGFGLWYYFRTHLPDATKLYIPLFKTTIELGWFYPIFVALVITASSNAVNLTDGLDGLAIGCLSMAVLGYTIMVYVVGRVDYSGYLGIPYVPGVGEVTVFSAALVGAAMGFLWFNSHPAEVFMGDTGAVALGGALGFIAVCAKQELLLFLVGAIFVIETLSVIIQVISFRGWGKRVFKIAPLHHHFQFAGWAEPKITVRFWIVAAILALLSIALLKIEVF
ncbi:MAG: phospho-N-acetylmuramoyl-pentapeptide-transferase [Planctomycetes bacterium]|nr:phospho-N-acetylmuramoyl-pentapeptide-transferase [Planctomycetota bacterium]